MTLPAQASRSEEAGSTEVWPPPRRSPALAPLLAALRWLPGPLAHGCLASLALVHGVASSSRRRRMLAWATAQHASGRSARSLAWAALAFRGRQVASRRQLGIRDLSALRARTTIEGIERLEAATRAGGVLLLGFHFGPLVDPVAFRAHGFPVTLGLRRPAPHDPADWWRHPPEDLVLFPNPAWRVRGLYELSRRLGAGRTVYLASDGLHGAEAFRIELPAAPLILRKGWLTLRRNARVTTLPVLSRREGRRIVVAVHAPLPAPVAGLAEDIAACRASLTPLVEDYVRRFPEQCFHLALQPSPLA